MPHSGVNAGCPRAARADVAVAAPRALSPAESHGEMGQQLLLVEILYSHRSLAGMDSVRVVLILEDALELLGRLLRSAAGTIVVAAAVAVACVGPVRPPGQRFRKPIR